MAEYYMLNKPRGCISACRDPRHKTVLDCFPENFREGLFHIGRLDRDTEGLLIITDDGELCNRLMKPESHVRKTYFFWALGDINEEQCEKLRSGVDILGTGEAVTAPACLEILERRTLSEIGELLSGNDAKMLRRRGGVSCFSGLLTITEGKKHQVKRMLGYVGCRVVYLKRLSIGALRLDEKLLPGEYRTLTEGELILLEMDN